MRVSDQLLLSQCLTLCPRGAPLLARRQTLCKSSGKHFVGAGEFVLLSTVSSR